MPRARLIAAVPAALTLLISPSAASAAQRWAAPGSSTTSGSCSAAAPCRIDAAVDNAAAGDDVVVPPGTYAVATSLEPPAGVDVHGVAGQPRPWLVGTSDLDGAVISAKGGGTISHLALDGPAALTLQGGTGEDLLLLATTGFGAKLVVSPVGTALRDSAVRSDATGDDAGLKLAQSAATGTLSVVGVTVQAPSDAAIICQVRSGTARVVDTIARGAAVDIDASKAPGLCTVSSSSFRAAASPGVVDGGGNQDLEPRFVDAAGGDLRQAAGSPTIDAGVTDPLLGAFDPAGCPRPLGAAVDMGAYEQPALTDACASAPAEPLVHRVAPAILGPPLTDDGDGSGDDQGSSHPTPPPVIGRHVVLAPRRGHVRFRAPGSGRFVDLPDAARVPVGSVIDATAGRVQLASAIDADGTVQAGTFWGTRFVVRQSRHGNGMTTLVLRGGNFRACRARATASRVPLASVSRRRHRHHVVRSLWARDRHGRFRTYGANSVATARGTAWLTQDRCDGTRTRVSRGAVAVRDLARHRTLLVRAGHAYLARRRG